MTARLISRRSTLSTPTDSVELSYSDIVLADSPIGYWRLDETSGTTAEDLVGANDGTYVNTPILGEEGLAPDSTGLAVRCVAANSEEITLPNNGLSATGSLEIWFRWTAGDTLLRDNTGAAGTGWILLNNAGTFRVRVAGTNLDTSKTIAQVRDGKRHHLVISKTGGGNTVVYLDGVEIVSSALPGNTATSTPWHLGKNGASAGYADATFDEFAIYDTALSSADVTAHYGSPPAETPPIGTPVGIASLPTAGASTTTITATTTVAVASGESIIVAFYLARPSTTLTSVTDSAGNVYTINVTKQYAGQQHYCALATCHNAIPLPSGGTITATWSAGTTALRNLLVCKVSGLSRVSALDQTATKEAATGVSWTVGPTGTLAQANEIVFVHANDRTQATANTPGTGWTELYDLDHGGSVRSVLMYKIVNSTAAVTADGSMGSGLFTAVLASYKGF